LVKDNQNISDLLTGCLHNDRNSQKALYTALRGYVFAICYRYLDSDERIEELLNKSFIELFKHIDQFYKGKYPDINDGIRGWLRKIVVMNCISHYRQFRLFSFEPSPLGLKYLPYESENGSGKPSDQDIIEAIRKLPQSHRLVFNLSVIEGMSHKDIGHQLGISSSLSASTLAAAREIIRNSLSLTTSQAWTGEESSLTCSNPGKIMP
jgi:RNA polymerase sigma factor (sigma-70 family)